MQEAVDCYLNKDFENGDKHITLANDILDRYKKSAIVSESTSPEEVYGDNLSFGIIQEVFENNIPSMYDTKIGKSFLKKYMKLIKEDKNLMEQFSFYHSIVEANNISDINEFVNETIECAPKIDKKSIKESNMKLINLLRNAGLDENYSNLDEEKRTLYESIDFLLFNTKNIKNLSSFVNAKTNIREYIESHIEENNVRKLQEGIMKSTKADREEVKKNLPESREAFVRNIALERQRVREERMESIFEKCKNETLNTINGVLDECEDEVLRNRITSIKEKIENKSFSKDRLSADIAEMMNINSTLTEG